MSIFNFEGIGKTIFGWGWTALLVFIVVGVLFGFFLLGLWIMRNRKFDTTLLEIINLGGGKIAIETSEAGWLKKRRMLFGLLEVGGETVCYCKKGMRRIFNVSSEDYHEFNGKKCLIAKRKDDDPDVLVPLSKFEVKNLALLAEIAPGDYRDAANQILEEKRREAYTWWDENKSAIISISLFMIMLVAMIVFFKFMQSESEGWRQTAERIMAHLSSKASEAP